MSCTQLDVKVINYIVRHTRSYLSKLIHRYTQLEQGQHLQSRVKPHQRLSPQRPRCLNLVQVQHLVMAYHHKQILVNDEQQHLKGQHQQLRVELHQRLGRQRLRCINRLKRVARLSNNKTKITLFFYRIFTTSLVSKVSKVVHPYHLLQLQSRVIRPLRAGPQRPRCLHIQQEHPRRAVSHRHPPSPSQSF